MAKGSVSYHGRGQATYILVPARANFAVIRQVETSSVFRYTLPLCFLYLLFPTPYHMTA